MSSWNNKGLRLFKTMKVMKIIMIIYILQKEIDIILILLLKVKIGSYLLRFRDFLEKIIICLDASEYDINPKTHNFRIESR